MLRKHHKFRQGHKVKITRFWPLNKDRLNLHTNPYIISVTKQRFSLLSLGYLWKHFFIVVLVCMFLLCSLDCKTVRIFAYSSTHEQSNKGSGTTLKTESKRLLRHALPIYFTHFAKKKTDCFTVYMFFKVFLSLYIHVRFYHPKRGCPTARKAGIQVLDSGFSTVDSGLQVLGSWLFVVFQLLAGFRIPWAGIRDSKATILDPTNKNFLYFRFHKQKHPVLRIPQTKISRIPDPTNKNFLYFRFHKQKHPVLRIPQTKISRIADPTDKIFPYFRSHKQNSCIPDPKSKNFPDCGIWSTLHVARKGVYISRLIHFYLVLYI